jgi:hypothetical protein
MRALSGKRQFEESRQVGKRLCLREGKYNFTGDIWASDTFRHEKTGLPHREGSKLGTDSRIAEILSKFQTNSMIGRLGG